MSALFHDRRGTTAIEFALVAPVVVTFMLGSVNLGMILWNWIGLYDAAMQAARCQASNVCTSQTTTQAFAVRVANGLGVSSGVVSTANVVANAATTTCNGTGNFWVVTINPTFSLFIPFVTTRGYTPAITACYPGQSLPSSDQWLHGSGT